MNSNPKSKQRIVIGYFLRSLQDKMQWEDNVAPISQKWLKIFTKEELKRIVTWLFMQQVPEEVNIETMTEDELLATIGDEYHVLGYLIDSLEEELKAFENPTPINVWNVLEQLGQETHYLATKVKAHWDDYDVSNYQSLAYKAGHPIPVYGIYDAEVKDEDRYVVTLPDTLFSSRESASEFLATLLKTEKFTENELKIMML